MGTDGVWRWILLRECVLARNPDGSSKTVVGVGHDITESRRDQELIRESNCVLEKVIDEAGAGMALVGPDGKFLRVNLSHCEVVGYAADELLAMQVRDVTHPNDLKVDQLLVAQISSGVSRTCRTELRYIRKDGTEVWVSLSVSLVRDQSRCPLYFVYQISDISDLKRASMQLQEAAIFLGIQKQELLIANERLESMATTDALTGLANRRRFDEEFSHLFSSARRYDTPLSVLLVDIDHFKSVNDRFGHLVGDRVLCKVALLLKQCARDSDVVARYGGEEFAIICSQTDLISAGILAGRLRQKIERADFDCGAITASIGIAAIDPADVEGRELLARTDGALYQSKEQGRNRVTIWRSGKAAA
jgi:diguanylate cyclase (GGDEF)-like protein/PAS domain S-box-containing protein